MRENRLTASEADRLENAFLLDSIANEDLFLPGADFATTPPKYVPVIHPDGRRACATFQLFPLIRAAFLFALSCTSYDARSD